MLARAAMWGLKRIFRTDYRYKKAGVVLMDLSDKEARQSTLFETSVRRLHSSEVMAVLDEMNSRYGRDTVRLGSAAGIGRWVTRFDRKTPNYTSNWGELPVAR